MLKSKSERHAIELLLKVQISPDQPMSYTNEKGIFKSLPNLGNFTVLSMEFPIVYSAYVVHCMPLCQWL